MGRVTAVSGPKAPSCVVHWNKRSVVLSGIMFLNVAIMYTLSFFHSTLDKSVTRPLKAYISEPLPYLSSKSTSLPPACTERNVTACTSDLLAFFRNEMHRVATTSFFASTAFDLYHESLPQPSSNHPLVAADLPYYVIYTHDQTTFASHFVVNASMSVPLAATSRLVNVPIFYHVMWTQQGNNDTSAVDYYIGIHRAPSWNVWVVTKLVARCVLVLYLVRCMWHDYYRHCFALATNLRRYGLGDTKGLPKDQAKVLYLLMGDPTSQILQHPVVLAGFLLDFWMSPDFVMRAILRVMQVADITNFFIASLYLSRTVWFSFCALRVSSSLLKRLRKETLCADVDPTLLTFAAVAVAGPISYGQSQLRALIYVYHYLCTATVHDATSIEMGVSALLYTIVMGCLPLTYGFGVGRWRSRRRVQVAAARSVKYQDLKHKWGLSLCLWPHRNVQRAGGSIHRLFAARRETKAIVGMSQTGTDCFIVLHTEAKTTHCVRVSLLTNVDRQHIATDSKTGVNAAVGYVDLDVEPPVVHTGANASSWVM